ncbi:MAG: SAM-dependent methyltransferase [Candidatus Melainabacteria bacterium HGW-Melainabacteria-1]|nr:MAG: SAM-dependent methyltransferase [Candidatus Melainabacteria bacterium HGW-Melainabacteria-1]
MSQAKSAAPYPSDSERGDPVASPGDPHRFELVYQSDQAPWDIESAQPAIVALAANEKIIGDVLDLGCGTGENALMLVTRGHMVWAIDTAPTAIERARLKAEARALDVTFVLGNALELEVLGEGFHTVIDSGLFHIFSDADRLLYLKGLHHVMFPGSCLYLLCFSDREPGSWGPRRVKRSELRQLFSHDHGFRVQSIIETRFHLRERPEGVKAWLATIERLEA